MPKTGGLHPPLTMKSGAFSALPWAAEEAETAPDLRDWMELDTFRTIISITRSSNRFLIHAQRKGGLSPVSRVRPRDIEYLTSMPNPSGRSRRFFEDTESYRLGPPRAKLGK